jgi:hypothetical protein
MKSLDIVVLCKLFVLQEQGRDWTYPQLASDVCLSSGETHASVKRLKHARLFDGHTKTVMPGAMGEFLIHGVKYAYPAEIGIRERGIPTSHSAPILKDEIISGEEDAYVWPYAKGNMRGTAVKPLSENAPKAVLKDDRLYDLLALVDAIRIGKVRERNLAVKKLTILIEKSGGNAKP